jgi:predicted AlkP superfamily pyrophosphatase or phosphodiesterase
MKEDKEVSRKKQEDIDILENNWFILSVLKNSEVFAITQREKLNEAYEIIDEIYKQTEQSKISQEFNWGLTKNRLRYIEDKKKQIDYLGTSWLELAVIRHSEEAFILEQREKIDYVRQILGELYRQYDDSKFFGDDFPGWKSIKELRKMKEQ